MHRASSCVILSVMIAACGVGKTTSVNHSSDAPSASSATGYAKALPLMPLADSLSAMLYEVLTKYAESDAASKHAGAFVKTDGSISVKHNANMVSCLSQSDEQLAVQVYGCQFDLESVELPLTDSSKSIQAILHAAILASLPGGDRDPASVALADDYGNNIFCSSVKVGNPAVMSYSCKFELPSAADLVTSDLIVQFKDSVTNAEINDWLLAMGNTFRIVKQKRAAPSLPIYRLVFRAEVSTDTLISVIGAFPEVELVEKNVQ